MSAGAEPQPERRPRLNPFAFPSDTTFRFALLVTAVLGATLYVWNWIYAAVADPRALDRAGGCLQLSPFDRRSTATLESSSRCDATFAACVDARQPARSSGGCSAARRFVLALARRARRSRRPWIERAAPARAARRARTRRRSLAELRELVARSGARASEPRWSGIRSTPSPTASPTGTSGATRLRSPAGSSSARRRSGRVPRRRPPRARAHPQPRRRPHVRHALALVRLPRRRRRAVRRSPCSTRAATRSSRLLAPARARRARLPHTQRGAALARGLRRRPRLGRRRTRTAALRRVLAALPVPAARPARRLRRSTRPGRAARARSTTRGRSSASGRSPPSAPASRRRSPTRASSTLVSSFVPDPLDMRFIAALAFAPSRSGSSASGSGARPSPPRPKARPGIRRCGSGSRSRPASSSGRSSRWRRPSQRATTRSSSTLVQGEDLLWGLALVGGLVLLTGWIGACAPSWLRSLGRRPPRLAWRSSLLAAAGVLSVFMAVFYVARDTRERLRVRPRRSELEHATIAETAWAAAGLALAGAHGSRLPVVVHRPFSCPRSSSCGRCRWPRPSGAGGRRRTPPTHADWAFLDARRRAAPAAACAERPLRPLAIGAPRRARLLGALAPPALFAAHGVSGGDAGDGRLPPLVLLLDARARARSSRWPRARSPRSVSRNPTRLVDALAAGFVAGSVAASGSSAARRRELPRSGVAQPRALRAGS